MRDVYLKMTISDERDIEFMVVPGNDLYFRQLAVALEQLAAANDATLKALLTLAQTVGTVGHLSGGDKAANHTLKTVAPLVERNTVAKDQIQFIRLLLGKSVRVQPEDPKTEVKGPT